MGNGNLSRYSPLGQATCCDSFNQAQRYAPRIVRGLDQIIAVGARHGAGRGRRVAIDRPCPQMRKAQIACRSGARDGTDSLLGRVNAPVPDEVRQLPAALAANLSKRTGTPECVSRRSRIDLGRVPRTIRPRVTAGGRFAPLPGITVQSASGSGPHACTSLCPSASPDLCLDPE